MWAKFLALSGPAGTRGACELHGWAEELHRAAGSLRIQAEP